MKKVKKTITAALTLALIISMSVIPLAADNQNDEQTSVSGARAAITEKSEVVYARLSSGGEAQNIYVVNHFTVASGGVFNDYGNYTSVVNMTDLRPLTLSNGEVSGETDSENYFYQGNLAENDLPWLYNIRYYLDGVLTAPEDLPGETGKLEINLTSSKNSAINDVFYDNYMQQITITLSIEKCQNITANGATIANAGKNRMLTYTVMPGSDADIVITADVKDFEMSGIEIAAVPFTMDIEIPDTEDILDDFTKLSDAITELNDGVGKLLSGAAEMRDGAEELKNGSSDINGGLAELESNSTLLTDASAQINGALMQINNALMAFGDSGADSIITELAQLPIGLILCANGLTQISNNINQYASDYAIAYEALDGAISGIPGRQLSEEQLSSLLAGVGDSEETGVINSLIESYTAAMTAKSAYEQIKPAFAAAAGTLEALSGSVDSIAAVLRGIATQITEALDGNDMMAQVSQLAFAISELTRNYGDFHSGLTAYAQGIIDLSDGFGEFNSGVGRFSDGVTEMYDGIATLHDGTTQMADETTDMPGLFQNEIDNLINEFVGGDFEHVSFTSSRNGDISFVQFVFVTESIEKPEIDTSAQISTEQKTFWDRLTELFR